MKVIYSCAWNKEKEKTWSGTTYSLYKALKKKINIEDCDVSLNLIEKILVKILSFRIHNFKIYSVTLYNRFKDYLIYKKVSHKKSEYQEDIILHVGSLVGGIENSYCYIDLSMDSLEYYKDKRNDLFEYSTYQNIPDNQFDYIRKIQNDKFKDLAGIFTMSKWLQNNLINYSNYPTDKVHFVGGGINVNYKDIKEMPKSKNKILFVGRDFYRKGGDILYNSFKILKEKYKKDAELYIIGPKEWPLDEKIEGVFFLGDINSSELSYYFNSCDIFCMPSRFEAYGLVFIEALVYGLPCIGRNEFEMNQFILDGYNGYLIDNDDEEELAIKMRDLMEDDQIKQNVRNERDKYIREYSWDTVADRMIKVFKDNVV